MIALVLFVVLIALIMLGRLCARRYNDYHYAVLYKVGPIYGGIVLCHRS